MSFTLTLHWNLANVLKIYHGIIELRHLIDPRRMVLAEEAVRRVKEGTSAVLLQSGLDEKWWAASLECCSVCEMFKNSWKMGKLLMKGDSENHFKAQ